MKWTSVFAAIGATTFFVSQVGAVTLKNQDETTYRLEVIYDEDGASVDKFKIAESESIADICPEGCVIRLSNGEETIFTGKETGVIRGGRFILRE